MSVYLITWNLNREKSSYNQVRNAFFEIIKRYPYAYDSNLETTVFVQTTQTVDQLYRDLVSVLDTNDRILVTKITSGAYAGWLNQEVVNWLNARL